MADLPWGKLIEALWNLFLLFCVVHTTIDAGAWLLTKWRNRGGQSPPPE